ncbi:Transposase (plasmid) [Roseomonas mucosa]|nr:Transposase [Roseomonas mucosa]
MGRYVEGWNRSQSFLLPESVDDYVGEDNPVRVVDAFVDELDLAELGFGRATPADTGHLPTILPCCSSSTSTAT